MIIRINWGSSAGGIQSHKETTRSDTATQVSRTLTYYLKKNEKRREKNVRKRDERRTEIESNEGWGGPPVHTGVSVSPNNI